MKSTLILFFMLSPMVLASPFLGNLFTPREVNEGHISDFRDKTKAQLQLEDGQKNSTEAEVELISPQNTNGMRQKFQLYGRLLGNFIGALQDGIGDVTESGSPAKSPQLVPKLHLSSLQEKRNNARESAERKIDAEEVTKGPSQDDRNPFERLVADGRKWHEDWRERKLVFLTTNVLPNLVSAWRSLTDTFNPPAPDTSEDSGGLDLEDEKSGAKMETQRLTYLPAKESSWETLNRVLKSFSSLGAARNAKIQQDSSPRVNGVVMLELFGSIFGLTWKILSQIGAMMR